MVISQTSDQDMWEGESLVTILEDPVCEDMWDDFPVRPQFGFIKPGRLKIFL